MASGESVVRAYAAAWGPVPTAERARLVDESCADIVTYTDHLSDVGGQDALVDHLSGFQSRFPGDRFELDGPVREHHRAILFGWRWVGPDGTLRATGDDFGELDERGQITRIVGFWPRPG
jgi:hypothetical protein